MIALRFRIKWASCALLINRVRQFSLIFVFHSEGAVWGTRWGVYHGNDSFIVTVSEDGDILGETLTFKTK